MSEVTHATAKELIGRAEAHADHAPAETKKIIRELVDTLEAFMDYNEWHQATDGLSRMAIDRLEKDIAEIRKSLYEGEG
jgi:hypothetical protein